MALYSVIFLGSAPVGGPIAGVIGQWLGARAGLFLGAVVAAAAGLWLLSKLGRRTRRPFPHEVEPLPIPAADAELAGEP